VQGVLPAGGETCSVKNDLTALMWMNQNSKLKGVEDRVVRDGESGDGSEEKVVGGRSGWQRKLYVPADFSSKSPNHDRRPNTY